jgi:hypothetical protein
MMFKGLYGLQDLVLLGIDLGGNLLLVYLQGGTDLPTCSALLASVNQVQPGCRVVAALPLLAFLLSCCVCFALLCFLCFSCCCWLFGAAAVVSSLADSMCCNLSISRISLGHLDLMRVPPPTRQGCSVGILLGTVAGQGGRLGEEAVEALVVGLKRARFAALLSNLWSVILDTPSAQVWATWT